MKKGQIHRHIEKLGSGRVGFLVEKLYHLESHCVCYIQLNTKMDLLHRVEQGGSMANLRSSVCEEKLSGPNVWKDKATVDSFCIVFKSKHGPEERFSIPLVE